MLKNNKGITLIALVITIIVLLILAGVSIAMLTGDNGVLSRASSAKVANAIGEAKDQISLIAAQEMTNYYEATYVKSTESGAVYNPVALDNQIIGKIGTSYSGVAVAEKKTRTGVSDPEATVKLTYQGYETTGHITSGKVSWDPIKETKNP